METFEEFKNLFSGVNIEPAHILVVGIVVAVFVLEMILVHKGILRFDAGVKRRDQAIAAGHVVKAKRIRYHDDKEHGYETNFHYYAKYEYVIEGNKHTYRYFSTQFPPFELTLYYLSNPRRPFHYEEKTSIFFILLYVIPFAVGVLVVKVFGINI